MRCKPFHATVSEPMTTALKFSPIDIEKRKAINFGSGDTIRVWSKILDKGKFRLQAFEGLVLARKHGTGPSATFTVRKVASGVGVERIFPLYSPMIDTIEVLKNSGAARAKLYYVRTKAVRDIRRKMKQTTVSAEERDAAAEVAKEVKE